MHCVRIHSFFFFIPVSSKVVKKKKIKKEERNNKKRHFLVALIASIFFSIRYYDSLEQKKARLDTDLARPWDKKGLFEQNQRKEVFFILIFLYIYIGSFPPFFYLNGIADKNCTISI